MHPILTEDSNKILSNYYQAQRRKNTRNKSRTTVRLLDSLIRLSQGHARLMYHEEVQIVDAVFAVVLVETAMEADSSVFDLHFDVQNDFPLNSMQNYRDLVEIVLKKLHLEELLEKELNALNSRPQTRIMIEPQIIVTDHTTESKFFKPKNFNREETNDNKSNANGPDKRFVNIQNIKRVKSGSSKGSKKIKLDNRKSDVINDLAALDCMPSVFDNPSADCESEEDAYSDLDLNKEMNIVKSQEHILNDSTRQNSASHKRTDNTDLTESIETSDNDKENRNKNTTDNTNCIKETVGIPKCRRYLNKFRFIPKDNESISELHEPTSKATETTENKAKHNNLEQTSTNEATSIFSENFQESRVFLQNLEAVPQSTQQKKPKFQFKKIENQVDNLKNERIPFPKTESRASRSPGRTSIFSEKFQESGDILQNLETVPQSTQHKRPIFKFKKADTLVDSSKDEQIPLPKTESRASKSVGATSIFSENFQESGNIFQDLEAVPQSTQHKKPKFRFKKTETQMDNLKNEQIPHPKTDSRASELPSVTTSIFSENFHESGDILQDLKGVPESTQHQRAKFKFKKKENQDDDLKYEIFPKTVSRSSESSGTTIFESQEDLEYLDFDL